ncbi:MAG: hypothetical protein JW754_05505 [Candidatus Aenigmarchaeota archaeon]|nr:hypothetical protein [Candidatus Aenigmarchaeota archaeon]
MRYIVLVFLTVVSIILVSGCTYLGSYNYNSNTPEGAGVIIESFQPDFAEVYSGEPVKFTMKVRNSGTFSAENGFAEMLGLDQTWKAVNQELVLNDELLPNEAECRYPMHAISLLPPDQSAGIQGSDKICTWTYIAPSMRSGLFSHYSPRVRFFYDYKSYAIKTVTIVPSDELKVLQTQGKTLPSETTEKSNSPVSIDITTATPVRSFGYDMIFPIIIKIKNMGDGTICYDSQKCKTSLEGGPKWNTFQFKIILPDDMTLYGNSCEETMDLYVPRGAEQTITCQIQASQPARLTQKTISVSADYGYFVDKVTDIRVSSVQMGDSGEGQE